MANESLDPQAEQYLQMDEEALFALLVPEAQATHLYSRGALIARGKLIFRTTFQQVQDNVCAAYLARPSTIDNSVDLTGLVATTLMATSFPAAIPVFPFAAIVVKIGLSELCQGAEDDGAG